MCGREGGEGGEGDEGDAAREPRRTRGDGGDATVYTALDGAPHRPEGDRDSMQGFDPPFLRCPQGYNPP